jgi:predicted DNA-binding transcriptional regulator YafY
MQNTTERRQEILYFISDRRKVTLQEIADEFNIGIATVKRDVQILMCSHPIDAVQGKGGGIRAMDGWYANKRYLTESQEKALEDVLNGLQPDMDMIQSILTAFAKPKA